MEVLKNCIEESRSPKSWRIPLPILAALLLLLFSSACEQIEPESKVPVLHTIAELDFENTDTLDLRWKKQGQVDIHNGHLQLVGDPENTTEWSAKIPLDSAWRRVRISGKVKIPSLKPQPQFGKTARLYTAFYSASGDLLSFIGDINYTHLTWRNPFEEWQEFEHSFNLPKYLDNNVYRDSEGSNVMDLRFQVREAEGELLLDDIAIEVIPQKYEMQAQEFHEKVLPSIKAKEKIGSTLSVKEIEAVSSVIHVNNTHQQASDENQGSKAAPLRSLNKALEIAIASKRATKIVLHEGDYFEENQIVMKGTLDDQPLLVIEGEGEVRISGSKRLQNWTQEKPQRYVHDWQYAMGETEQIWGGKGPWGKLGYIKPGGLRKELVLVNGERIQQVFAKEDLVDNSFFVDDTLGKLWLQTRLDLENPSQKVEAGILGDLLNVSNRSNLVLRNLSFVNGAKFVPFGSVEFSFCENILVENCQFLNNNSTGLLFNYVEHVTVRNCISNYNGWNGMKFEYAQYIRSENNEFSYNGWRANMGDLNGWDLAGNKNFNTHHFIVDGAKMYDNRGHGLWFDWCNSDITMQNLDIVGNYGNGIYYEVSQGPAILSHTRLSQNGNSGISVAEAWNLTIDQCQIYDNHSSQIEARARFRTADDEYSAPAYTFAGANLTVKNSTVASVIPKSYLTEAYSMWDSSEVIFANMLESYHGKDNAYFHSVYDTAMTLERHRWANQKDHNRVERGGRLSLEDWAARAKEENAHWVDTNLPRLVIEGLPQNQQLKQGQTLTLEVSAEHAAVENLTLGLLDTHLYENKFKYALSEFMELSLEQWKAQLPALPVGSYALVAYGTLNGKLIQSHRTDLWVVD